VRKIWIVLALVGGMLLPVTAAHSATKVFSTMTATDIYNRPDLNPKYDIQQVEVGLFDNDLDQIHFWIRFKQPLTAAMFNDNQGSWAGILIDTTGDDDEEIVITTSPAATYSGNFSKAAFASFRNNSKSCSAFSWMDLENNSEWLGFRVSQKCLGLPNKFRVQAYADFVSTDSSSFDYAPDAYEVIDLGDYYNPKPKATMLVPTANSSVGKLLSNYSSPPENLVNLSASLRNSVATIECVIGNTGGTGTGWSAKVDIPLSMYKSYLITNYHVVSDCVSRGTVNVILNNGSKVEGRLAAWDPNNDLAGIYVTGSIPPLIWQGAFPLQGSWVGVIGSPKGVPGILTTGILSSESVSESIVTFTAPINPGNSGGPVFDSVGRVIAIATAKVRDSEGFGIGNGVPLLCNTVIVCPTGLTGWGSTALKPEPSPTPNRDKRTQYINLSREVSDTSVSVKYIALTAKADSGLPVTSLSDDLSVCDYEKNQIILYSVGTCTIYFDQAGNDKWNPASPSVVTFEVMPRTSAKKVIAKITEAPKSWAGYVTSYEWMEGPNPLKSNKLTTLKISGSCTKNGKTIQGWKNTDSKGKKYPNGSRPVGSPWKCTSGVFEGKVQISGGTRFYIVELPKSHVGTKIEFRINQELDFTEYIGDAAPDYSLEDEDFGDIFSPISITDLRVKSSGSQHTFSFTVPSKNPATSTYELGFAILKREGLDPSFDLDYPQFTVHKTLSNDSFTLSNSEIRELFRRYGASFTNRSIMFKVRTNWAGSVSTWGNGVYLLPNQVAQG